MRLYGVGAVGREAIAKHVHLVLSHLEGVPIEVPTRWNVFMGGHEDVIAHYFEGEVREILGETRGCLGCPTQRLKKVRAI